MVDGLKASMAACRKSFKLLTSNSREGYAEHEFVLDGAGRPVDYVFLDVNRGFERGTGLRRREVIGRRVTDFLSPEDAAFFIATYWKVVETGRPVGFERHSSSLGKLFEVNAYKTGELRFVALFRDASPRLELELERESMRQGNARYKSLSEDIPAMVCSFLVDSTLTYVNRAYADYFHLRPEDLVGRKFLDLLPPELADAVKDSYMSLTPDTPCQTYAHEVFKGGGGERAWHEWTDRAFFDDKGEVREFQSVGRDITDRVDMEKRLLEAVENERRRVAGSLHDDLCQQLKRLEIDLSLLESALARRGLPEAAAVAALESRINQATRSAYDIANDMMSANVDKENFAAALEILVRDAANKSAAGVVGKISRLWRPADSAAAVHLYHIAKEALNNAARHAAATKIKITWEGRPAKGDAILAIRDDGRGMPSKRPGGKSGLGIHVMESRARAIGALLEISAPPGGGVLVACRCPRSERTHA